MRRKVAWFWYQAFIAAIASAVTIVGPEEWLLGIWVDSAVVSAIGLTVTIVWYRLFPWQPRGCVVTVREDSEVSFRPFLRVAVALDSENLTDRSLRLELTELEAVLLGEWTRRVEPIHF